MSLIDLDFMQRYQGELDTAIKNFMNKKDVNGNGTAIASGTDMNELKTKGVYYIATEAIAGSMQNLPMGLCGKVLVSQNAGGIMQYYIPNHTPKIYQRECWNNQWGSWLEYAKKPVYLTGTLTAGNTNITFNSSEIKDTSLIDVYTSVAGLGYQSMSGNIGTVTVVYEAQPMDITVTLEIKSQV